MSTNQISAVAHFPKMTYARFQKLRAYFSDLKNLWRAELSDLIAAGLNEDIAHEFLIWREANPTEKISERLAKENIWTISIGDPNYPRLLAQINDPPITLFIRGKLSIEEIPAIGVVGTRRCTDYGRRVCADLAGALAQRGIVVVSGLALGIDGIAHDNALQNRGITWAVLGSGVDQSHIFPSAHQNLAKEIIDRGGAIISEYPPGFAPTSYSFPARNRIIAGLTLGTLVIEAPEESGALITAKSALDYNREVFAVPHSIYSLIGAGGNNLIKLGAKAVTKVDDILEALNLAEIKKLVQTKIPIASDQVEEKILSLLTDEPKQINEIIQQSGLSGAEISAKLTIMEISGLVKNLGGMNYAKNG